MIWLHEAKGYYSDHFDDSDNTYFAIMVKKIDKILIAFFKIPTEEWEGRVDKKTSGAVSALTVPMWLALVAGNQRTIREEPEADSDVEVRGRGETGVAPDALPRVRRSASAESRPLELTYTHKRAINHPRSDNEYQNIVDAPQWTVDSLTRSKFSRSASVTHTLYPPQEHHHGRNDGQKA